MIGVGDCHWPIEKKHSESTIGNRQSKIGNRTEGSSCLQTTT